LYLNCANYVICLVPLRPATLAQAAFEKNRLDTLI